MLKEYFLKNKGVSFALVFGSQARNMAHRMSDLDLALFFTADDVPQGMEHLFLINRISNLTGKEVDLIILNNAPPFLRHQILKNFYPIIIKDPVIFRQFREATMADYEEYNYVSGMNRYD